jgi:hypothetical protein
MPWLHFDAQACLHFELTAEDDHEHSDQGEPSYFHHLQKFSGEKSRMNEK